jgi:predicted KAP-like P-loop ATPase
LLDEIDRLSDQEVREVAQTVKSVADFPMFSYLLAYDPDRVARALGHDDLKLGFQYLEKLCRSRRVYRVPPPEPWPLRFSVRS